jgi:hypothetical protein
MQFPRLRFPIRLIPVYLGAIVCGAVAERLHVPLPWMLGALAFSMTLGMSGVQIAPPRITRVVGQLLVAVSVGLSFTPVAVAVVAAMIVPMVFSAAATIGAGLLVSLVLMRLAHVDAVSAMLSSVPIGPVETANLATRHGVPAGPVVFAQTLRIVLLVVLIPPVLLWIDGGVADPSAALRAIPWTPDGATLLVVVGLAGGILAQVLRLSNPFFLGPLAGSALAAAFSLPISGLPYPVLAAAQLFLGVFLGSSFDRSFLQRFRAFIPVALLSTLLLIALCTALGMGLSLWTGEGWQVMVLSTAPGSVTEMALTAKVLQQGIAVVTAFHVVRLMIMMPLVPVIIGLAVKVARHYRIGPQPPRD